jgi:SAM-dependent methyltransferase
MSEVTRIPGRLFHAGAFLLGVLGALAAAPALAQPDGPKGDVPYVPTPQVTVDEMLRLANVGPRDFILDLGSGDGRIVITAARKFGARGLGVDLDFHLVIQSEENARQAGVENRVNFLQQDLFKTDLAQATVITMYLLPGVTRRLRPRLLELKPGTRIVSHDFDLEDWKPDRKTYIRKNVFLWIVPAKVEGRWQARVPLPPIERQLELTLTQRFQEVNAHARLNGVPTQVWEPRLEGERISFMIVDSTDRDNEATLYFEGRVSGDVIEGNVARGVGPSRITMPWRAARARP